MAESVPTLLRGLIVHDSRISLAKLDTTLSSYQESGQEPDQPTASASGWQELEAPGDLVTLADAELRIATQKPGLAIGGDEGGRFRWRDVDDAATGWRGHLSPNKVTGYKTIAFGADNYCFPHAITTPQHKVVCVYSDTTNGDVLCQTLDPSDDTWSGAITVDNSASGPACVVRCPDNSTSGGRLICLYIRSDLVESGVTYYTLGLAHSDDDGATWTVDAEHLPGWRTATTYTGSAVTVQKIRAVYHDGYITLLIQTFTATMVTFTSAYHLVSEDLGASFDQIEELSATMTNITQTDLYTRNSDVVLFFLEPGTNEIKWARKQSPRAQFTDDASWNTTTSIVDTQEVAPVYFDDALYLYHYGETSASNVPYHLGMARRDPDTMDSARESQTSNMDANGALQANWPGNLGDDTNEYLYQICATPYKGGVLLLHNTWRSGAAANDISVLHLGGYSSIDWRVQTAGSHRDGTPSNYGYLWVGTLDPATVAAWTTAGAGTGSFVSGGRRHQTAANTLYHSRDGSTAGNPCLIWARVTVDSGGSLTADDVAINVRRADGVSDYDCSLRLSTTSARVVDNNNAGSTVGSDTTGLSAGVARDWLIALGANTVTTYYKATNATLWTAGPTGSLTNDGATPSASNRVRWGHISNSTSDSTWAFLSSSIDSCSLAHGVQAFSNPEDLQGRPFSTAAQWIGDQEGLQIRAKGGPAFKGDAWTLQTRAAYGIQNIHPEIEPSPAVYWRSTNTSSVQTFVWTPNSGSATRFLSSSIGLYLARYNFKTCYLEGKQVGSGTPGTWDTLATIQPASTLGSSLTYRLSGDRVYPGSSTPAGSRMIEAGELVNGYVLLTWTGGGGGTAAFKILSNTEGIWRADTRHCEIRVEGDTSVVNTPSTLEILPPAAVVVVHGVDDSYESYRLRIPNGLTTYEGYYRLGAIVLGPLIPFGHPYSWGRVVRDQAIRDVYEYADGRIRVRDRGAVRREVEFAWVDPIDSTTLYDASPNPDFVTARDAAGYEGIALKESGLILAGLLRETRACQPVVYCPLLSVASGASPEASVYTGPEYVYGWPSDVVTRSTVLGDELDDELHTYDAITIREIL